MEGICFIPARNDRKKGMSGGQLGKNRCASGICRVLVLLSDPFFNPTKTNKGLKGQRDQGVTVRKWEGRDKDRGQGRKRQKERDHTKKQSDMSSRHKYKRKQ